MRGERYKIKVLEKLVAGEELTKLEIKSLNRWSKSAANAAIADIHHRAATGKLTDHDKATILQWIDGKKARLAKADQ